MQSVASCSVTNRDNLLRRPGTEPTRPINLSARRPSSRAVRTREKPSAGRVSSGGDAPATVSLSRDRRAGGGWERAPSLVRRRGWRVGRTEGADRSPVAKAPLEARPGLSIAGETSPTHK